MKHQFGILYNLYRYIPYNVLLYDMIPITITELKKKSRLIPSKDINVSNLLIIKNVLYEVTFHSQCTKCSSKYKVVHAEQFTVESPLLLDLCSRDFLKHQFYFRSSYNVTTTLVYYLHFSP